MPAPFYKKKGVLLSAFFAISCLAVFAQTPKPDSAVITREQRYAKVAPLLIFPLIKGSIMSGVLPVSDITNKVDPKTKMKLIFNFTRGTANKAQGTHFNEGLEEIGRILNLHIAAGIKKENLKAVIVFHSSALLSVLTNEYYQKNYKSQNPNLDLLKQLQDAGVELVVCGQSMGLRGFTKADLLPGVQIAQSALTTMSKYEAQGYIPFVIEEEK